MNPIYDKFPEIDLGDIKLREIKPNDTIDFYPYITDPKVTKYLGAESIPDDFQSAEKELMYWGNLFKSKFSIFWAVALASNNKLIGTCGFNVWVQSHKRVEISYDLNPAYWNQGIATRCVKAVCDFAFEKMDVNRIQATVATDNYPSMKLLTKAGFAKEGTLRKYAILSLNPVDYHMFSKVRK